MLRQNALDFLYRKKQTVAEFNWDTLFAPSLYCFMSEYEIEKLYNVATSIRYAGDTMKKDKAIKEILLPLGFKRLASGTNRIVFTYLEDPNFLIKVAIDKAGMQNTPDEFRNQALLKPFVTKCFESHPTGIIGSFERIMPITNKEEYISIWDDVYDMILNLIGEYVIEDIGTKFFMNTGLRKNFGPVLCDYPEVFKLDGNKLYCNKPVIPGQKMPLCGGSIDYDDGFNYLVCTKCGKRYKARDIANGVQNKLIIMKGDIDMDVQLIKGGKVIVDGRDYGTDSIKPPSKILNRSGVPDAHIITKSTSINTNDPTMTVTNMILQKQNEAIYEAQNKIQSDNNPIEEKTDIDEKVEDQGNIKEEQNTSSFEGDDYNTDGLEEDTKENPVSTSSNEGDEDDNRLNEEQPSEPDTKVLEEEQLSKNRIKPYLKQFDAEILDSY